MRGHNVCFFGKINLSVNNHYPVYSGTLHIQSSSYIELIRISCSDSMSEKKWNLTIQADIRGSTEDNSMIIQR